MKDFRLSHMGPGEIFQLYTGLPVPDPITFVVSPDYLNQPNLYPRQATLIKTIFLRDDLFCADEKTEILTRRGWKQYTDLEEGEDVLTLNTSSGRSEWAPAERVNVFPVTDEPLYSMESKGHSSLTTHNHRWPVERHIARNGSSERVKRFVETKDLSKADSIPCAATVDNLPDSSPWSDSFVELLAWYWTEGTSIVGSKSGIKIGQSKKVNPDHVNRIRDCLLDLFGPPSDSLFEGFGDDSRPPRWREDVLGDMVYFRLNYTASIDLKLIAKGPAKIVDMSFIGSLTKSQLDIFIDTSIHADGHERKTKNGTHRTISQGIRERLDPLQMACSLAGIRTVLREEIIGGSGPYAGTPRYVLSLLEKRNNFTTQHVEKEIKHHTGVVWCPTTKNKTWLARRDGKVYFTGNTDYDREVIEEWSTEYLHTGNGGIQPDIMERIQILKSEGRKWFREVLLVMGRRAGKGYLSALCMAYVLWNFMAKGNPQAYYGISQNKQLTGLIFAGKLSQAKDMLWKDLADVITSSTCFDRYVDRRIEESITLFAPHDFVRMHEGESVKPTFNLVPKEATPMAGRGPASFLQGYDEMAHVTKSVAKSEAGPVWDAATPSLDQFGLDAFISIPSSPWQMIGKFYELYKQSIERNEDGTPAYPSKFMVQLSSWAIYEDYEQAEFLPLFPEGFEGDLGEYKDKEPPRFKPLKKAIQTYDVNMRNLERANPDQFKVERRSHFAETLDAYLDPDKVDAVFEPWEGRPSRYGPPLITRQERGPLSIDYACHLDPAAVNDRFGLALGHVEHDDKGVPHVVFDLVKAYDPVDYEDHTIDYPAIVDDIWENIILKFHPTSISHDQWSGPFVRQELKRRVHKAGLPKRVNIFEHTATRKSNWTLAETFKASINLGLVHCHEMELAKLEMKFLQEPVPGRVDHPDTGPVTTKDVFDAMSHVVYRLIGERVQDMMREMAEFGGGALPGGIDPLTHLDPDDPRNQRRSVHDKLSSYGRLAARGRFGSMMGAERGRYAR